MLVVARYIVRAIVLLLPMFLRDPAMLLIGVHVLSIVFATVLRPAKSDAPTRLLSKSQHLNSVILRSMMLLAGMALILFSDSVPNSFLLSIPGALLYWATNVDAVSSELMQFSLIHENGSTERDNSSPPL